MTKILFDLDETLYSGDLIHLADIKLRQEFKHPNNKIFYNGSKVKDLDLLDIPEIIRYKCYELFKDPIYAVHYKHPIIGSKYVLYYLQKYYNYQLGIVTSRPNNLYSDTCIKLSSDFPSIDFDLGINFSNTKDYIDINNKISKKEIIEKIKPNYYFDDMITYCNEAAEIGIENVYLISNKYTGWNQDISRLHYKVKIIKNIMEANFNGN